MSLLYSAPSFRYPEPEFRKNQEMRDFNHYHCLPQNSGLARNQSAPSSFFDNLVIDTSDCGGGDNDGRIRCEDFQYLRSSSPDLDTMLEKFTSSCDALEDSGSHEWQDLGERAEIKQEVADSEMAYRSLSGHDLVNDNSMSVGMSVDRTFGVVHYMNVKNSNSATKMSPPNGSNLLRQNSSPPGLLSNLAVDNGTRVLPQIAEVGNQDMATCSPDPDVRKRRYMDSFANGAWDDTSLNGFKRLKDNDGRAFTGLNMLDDRSVNSKNHVAGLTHHLSLPKTAVEMASIEKYLQFQGSVPCKIRAKRGCATHPRSIAERVRRTRISERIKKLQDLFPNMDKHTNTADMLDLAVEYIMDLQEQVKTLSETKAKCSCSNRQKQY